MITSLASATHILHPQSLLFFSGKWFDFMAFLRGLSLTIIRFFSVTFGQSCFACKDPASSIALVVIPKPTAKRRLSTYVWRRTYAVFLALSPILGLDGCLGPNIGIIPHFIPPLRPPLLGCYMGETPCPYYLMRRVPPLCPLLISNCRSVTLLEELKLQL